MSYYIIVIFIFLFTLIFGGAFVYSMPITGIFSDDHRYIEGNYGVWECIQAKKLSLKEDTPDLIKQDLLKNNDCSSSTKTRISFGFLLGTFPIIFSGIVLVTGIFAGRSDTKNNVVIQND